MRRYYVLKLLLSWLALNLVLLLQAKDEQRPDLLIPKAQFQQEVQVIAKNLKTEIIFHESAVEALQEVAEAHLMGLIEDASVCATYDNR